MKRFFIILIFMLSSNIFAKTEYSEVDPAHFVNSKWEVMDFYRGDYNKPFIFVLQDVHCHEQVQYIIFDFLVQMKKMYDKKFVVVGVEGNTGEIDTSILQSMIETEVKESICQNLIKRGLLTGAEYYDILYPKNVQLFGVEDVKIYNENLAQIKKGLFEDAIVSKEIKILQDKNKDSKRIFYGKEMYEVEKLRIKYEENKKINLEEYINGIIKITKYDRKFLMNYKNLELFLRRKDSAKKLDEKTLAFEVSKISQAVDKYLGKDEKKALQKLNKEKKHEEYYRYFAEVLFNNRLKPDPRFQNFNTYLDIIDIDKKLDNIELYNEVEQFVYEANYKAATNVQEKEIIYLDRYTELLNSYVNNKVSSKQRAILDAEINDFVNRAEKRYGEIQGKRILSHYNIMQNFYQTAIKRNEIMVQNLLKVASPISALVIGGFHTEGILEILRAKGSGYMGITPKLQEGVNESLNIYLNRMKEEKGL